MKINNGNGEEKKIKLIENLSVSGTYNNAIDSLKMSNISISMRTKLSDKINLKFNSSIDPYELTDNGTKINKYLLESGNLGRITNLNFDISSKNGLNDIVNSIPVGTTVS